MMSPARAARAAVPAVIGAGNGMETDGPQPECRQALILFLLQPVDELRGG